MSENIIILLLDELKRKFLEIEELKYRVERLEKQMGNVTPVSQQDAVELSAVLNTSKREGPSVCKESTERINTFEFPNSSVQQISVEKDSSDSLSQEYSIYYFKELSQNEDGEIYVKSKDISKEPDNYVIRINGEHAEVYFTSDESRISEMMKEYGRYFQPCRKANTPEDTTTGVETAKPGRFVLEDDQWIQEEKMTIKFT